MTKQEASDIFDSKDEDVLNKLLDYILIDKDYNEATKFIMNTVGCDEITAQAMVLETIPTNTESQPVQYNNQVKCPFCQSTNTHKISGTERAVSVIGLGLFGKKINKSFKCKNCSGTF